MRIKSIQVQNFCCIRNEKLPSELLTALIGPNGSGKSSFLRLWIYSIHSMQIILKMTFIIEILQKKLKLQLHLPI